MIGNNSAGAHSILYGKTVDHILELNVVLSNGDEAVFKPLDSATLLEQSRGSRLENRIYREIQALAIDHRDKILERYPKLMRRVSGYNLDEFIKDQPFSLARMVVGSEGTLAVVTEAKLRIMPRPKFTALDVVTFDP
jgi:FAD/FMN-containing dehydrogenase